jgi:MinD-like ATPase involved in chromosome partitioning or flagellar assembly
MPMTSSAETFDTLSDSTTFESLADTSSGRKAAEEILERLAAAYPELRVDIFDSPRLSSALEAITRTTALDQEQIFESLTAREMASAQRPIGVLISRCTELLESSNEPTPPQSVDPETQPVLDPTTPLAVVHHLTDSRKSTTEPDGPEQPDELDHADQPPTLDSSEPNTYAQGFTPALTAPQHRPRPTRGLRKTICRSSFGLVNLGPGKRERQEQEVTRRITTPIQGARNIVMLAIKGGVGKTTVSLGLGHTFATFRNDRIVAIDASPDPGTLGQRVSGTNGSIRDLVGMSSVTSYADIQTMTSQQSTGLEIISTDRLFDGAAEANSDDYRDAVRCLSSYFNMVLTDCGTGVATSTLNSLLEVADQVVIVTAPMVDAGWSTGMLLDCLDDGGHGSLVSNATVVVNHLQQRVQVNESQFDSYFATRCRAVIHLPWDEQLASGGALELERMSVTSRDAYRALAATVTDGLVGMVDSTH